MKTKVKTKIVFSTIYILVFICVLIFLSQWFLTSNDPGTSLFFYYSNLVFGHLLPYRDFLFEYPPLAILFMIIPRFFTFNFAIYQILFWIILCLLGLFGLWITIDLTEKLSITKKYFVILLYIFLLPILGPIALFRFDLIPGILVLIALWLKKNNKSGWAWFVLGLAIATKLYPILLVPFFLIDDIKNIKILIRNIIIFFLSIFLAILPWLNCLKSLDVFIKYQTNRGVQIESLWSNLLLLNHQFFAKPIELISEAGAIGVVPFPHYFVPLSFIFLIIGYLFLVYLYFKNRQLLTISFLAILLFILTNRVFSPQYLAWLIMLFPLIFIEIKNKNVIIISTIIFILATFLTSLMYPYYYISGGLLSFSAGGIYALTFRNALLLVLFFVLITQPKNFAGGRE